MKCNRNSLLRSKPGKAPFSNQARAFVATYPHPRPHRPATSTGWAFDVRVDGVTQSQSSAILLETGAEAVNWRHGASLSGSKPKMQKWNSSSGPLFVMSRRIGSTRLCQAGLLT
jgi:hypothetical protein